MDYFLRIDEIHGSSTDKDHRGWMDIEWFLIGDNRGGQQGGEGKVKTTTMRFATKDTLALPELYSAVASGKHYEEAELEADDRRGTVHHYLLKDVVVASFQSGESGDPKDSRPIAHVEIQFDSIHKFFDSNRK